MQERHVSSDFLFLPQGAPLMLSPYFFRWLTICLTDRYNYLSRFFLLHGLVIHERVVDF